MVIRVDSQALTISWGGREDRCRLGKGGVVSADAKREGDGATPLGCWPVRFCLWRADRLARPDTRLTCHAVTPNDLWCDAPDHPAYNRWCRAPLDASHERLWRDDMAYDLLVVLGHNDGLPVPGMGSAIFLHLDRPDHRSTLGCVAVEPDTMIGLLRRVAPGDLVEIV